MSHQMSTLHNTKACVVRQTADADLLSGAEILILNENEIL
jgi:hypothetical protein